MFKIFQSQIEGFDAHVHPGRFRHIRYWAEGIKWLLDDLGFIHFWLSQDFQIPCYELIRNQIRDHFTQNRYAALVMLLNCYTRTCTITNLINWRNILNAFQTISYMSVRSELAALRLSAHNLKIERGRHIDVQRENRICRLYSMGMAESEFHLFISLPIIYGLKELMLTSKKFIMTVSSKNCQHYVFKFKLVS